MPYIIKEDELMHFGRKGMKWYEHIFGDEKTRRDRARNRATRRIERRTQRDLRDEDSIHRTMMRQRNLRTRRRKEDPLEVQRATKNYLDRKIEIERMAKKEIKKVQKMTLQDFHRESMRVWTNRAQVGVHNVLNAGLYAVTLGRHGTFQAMNTDAWRTQWRMEDEYRRKREKQGG